MSEVYGEPLFEAARAVCASTLTGFCANMGGHFGCENGRGKSGRELCKATGEQLNLSGHIDTARCAIVAYLDRKASEDNASRLSTAQSLIDYACQPLRIRTEGGGE